MKLLKRIVSLLLMCLSVALLFAFFSCGDSDKNEKELEEIESIFDHIANESETQEGTEIPTETQTEIGKHIYVIIPSGASSALASKAQEFVEALSDKIGVLSTLKYDNEHSSSPEGTVEILVGNTDRLESKNAMGLLKKNDYLCRWDTDYLVICGGSDESTVVAVESFINEFLPLSSKYSLMESGGGFECFEIATAENSDESETEMKKSTINGYSVDEFSIVYTAANKCGEKALAEMLRDLLCDRTGYLLDVVSSEALNSKTGKTITLSVDESLDSAILSKEGSVTLNGCNGYTLSLVAEKFIENLDASCESGTITWSCDERINVTKGSFVFDVMTYVLKKSENADAFIELLDILALAYQDAYVIDGVDDDGYERLLINLPDNYTIYKIDGMAVVYKKSFIRAVSAKSNDKSVEFSFEFSFGQTLKYTYFFDFDESCVDSNFAKTMRKGICFALSDSYGDGIPPLKSIAQGKTTEGAKNLSYNMLIGELLSESSSSVTVKNTSQKLSCSAKLYVNVSDGLLKLNDALK